jgi:hypothetical protein
MRTDAWVSMGRAMISNAAVVDYSRSYVFFTTKGRTNTARLMVEARCEVFDEERSSTEEFFFFASCKAEDTYAPRRLFKDPNYDFCGIFSATEFKIFRTPALFERDENSVGSNESAFESVRLLIRRAERAQILEGAPAIIEATRDGFPLVGRTEVRDESRGQRVTLEYPIKTMNISPERGMFQVDTGPIPFPAEDAPADARTIARMRLAFVAYNTFDTAELILQQPTPILSEGRELGRVLHYAEIRELPAKNTVFALGSGCAP